MQGQNERSRKQQVLVCSARVDEERVAQLLDVANLCERSAVASADDEKS
jgi:hypothetical protein